jgi:hypothetical protein
LIVFLLIASLVIEGRISKLVIISIFVLVIIYGRFFDKSTESIVEANFAQKKATEALEELTKNLQQKVDEQTKELRQAYEVEKKAREDLQTLNEQKNEFMLITQHHLRTPLTSMRGYVDLIENGTFGKVPKKLKEVICRFGCSSENLIKIVNEFLDLSQFQMGEKVVSIKDNIDLKEILDRIIKELEFQANKKDLKLTFKNSKDKVSAVKADPSKLELALFNVIDNSIKYTEKGEVIVEVQEKKNAPDFLEIIVKDTGIGMDSKDVANLFNRLLTRGEGAKKVNITGRGIGLYLSAKIIEAHNGKIWAESEGEGKGSTFHVTLPVSS